MKEYSLCRATLMGIVNEHPECCNRFGRIMRIDVDALDEAIKADARYKFYVGCEVDDDE